MNLTGDGERLQSGLSDASDMPVVDGSEGFGAKNGGAEGEGDGTEGWHGGQTADA